MTCTKINSYTFTDSLKICWTYIRLSFFNLYAAKLYINITKLITNNESTASKINPKKTYPMQAEDVNE